MNVTIFGGAEMTISPSPGTAVPQSPAPQPVVPEQAKSPDCKGSAKEGLQSSIDFVKYILTLSGGAIAFAMQPSFYGDSRFLKFMALFCCASLVISIFSGMLVHSRGCVMLSKSSYDLEDKFLKRPGQINQVAFCAGILFLGIAIAFKTVS